MSKYQPLADHLGNHTGDSWRATFEELEKTLGSALPKAARGDKGWWANDADTDKPHRKAWLGAGWRAEDVDVEQGLVVFRRAKPKAEKAARKPATPKAAPAPKPAEPDPTAHSVMAAAGAEYEKAKAVDVAKKAGIAAALLGVVAGIGLMVRGAFGRR